MLHETCIPMLMEDFFKTDPRISETKSLERDGKHIAFNSYDYQCLKDEIDRLPDDIKARFEILCPTLSKIITETDNRANEKYPVRDVQYFRHRHDLFYISLRVLDEVYYTATTSISKNNLAAEFRKTAIRRSVILNFAEYGMDEKLLNYLKKPRAFLKQLIAVEFNAGDAEKHGRGTFGQNKGDWMYPLLDPDNPAAGRVTAFKMTVSLNELVAINTDIKKLKKEYSDKYAKDTEDANQFDTRYPLLAILGIDDREKGFFCDNNIVRGKYDKSYATVKYSSRLSKIIQFSNLAEKAVTDQVLLEITMTNGRNRKFDFCPYRVLHQFNNGYISGIDINNKRYLRFRFDKIASIKLTDQKADLASWAHLLPNEDVEECEIALGVGGNFGDYAQEDFIESMQRINVRVRACSRVRGTMYNPYIHRYLKFEAKPCYTLFEKLDKLHRNGQLIDIFPDEVKSQYEEFWAGLGKKKYSYKYFAFNWSNKSDDDYLTN